MLGVEDIVGRNGVVVVASDVDSMVGGDGGVSFLLSSSSIVTSSRRESSNVKLSALAFGVMAASSVTCDVGEASARAAVVDGACEEEMGLGESDLGSSDPVRLDGACLVSMTEIRRRKSKH